MLLPVETFHFDGLILSPCRQFCTPGAKATESIQSVCPLKVRIALPVSISVSFNLLPATTTFEPSGEKAKDFTTPTCF